MSQCCLKIKDVLPRLPQGEAAVASYILKDPTVIVGMSISELSAACSVSAATVVRFCKSVGCRGFKDLCVQLSLDITTGHHNALEYSDIHPGDTTEAILKSIRDNAVNSINNTLEMFDRAELEKAVDLLCVASRVDFYGVGFSGFIALDAQNKFIRIGKTSMCATDTQLQLISAMNLKAGDVAVLVSYTGETKDIIELAENIRATGAATISITKFGENTLSGITDISLHTVSEEGFIRSGAMSSRIGQLTAVDALYSLTVSRIYEAVKPNLDVTIEAMINKKTLNIKL